MQRCHAGALDSIEYRLAFESSSSEDVEDPIASHLRDVLAICQWSMVPRSTLKPILHELDSLCRLDEDRMHRLTSRTGPSQVHVCKYCNATNSLIVKDYLHICQDCGYENDSMRIQEEAVVLPRSQVNCGSVKDSWRLDASYRCVERTLDVLDRLIQRLCADHLMTLAQRNRAMYLATLFVTQRPRPRRHEAVAASCVMYALLETWALSLVPAKVYVNKQWATRWVLPTAIFPASKKQTKHV